MALAPVSYTHLLLGDWTYQLVGDKRTVNIAVGGVVVGLALIAGFGGVRLGSYHQRTQEAVSYTHLDVYKRQSVNR